MGGSKKKKKRSGGGVRRTQSKDHHSTVADNSEILTEEVTALCAIFQEDCIVASESPPRIRIKLRPYSKDTGYEDSDVCVQLSVRCLPGYPYKCPKLQIIPEKGLSKTDPDNLLSLLYDQANSNAREWRVMIYNLVEAAQEFLSEVLPQEQTRESFLWTPYAHCILPDYCSDANGCSLCDTYLVCWAYVEAHKAGRVRRQFNRYQDIPRPVDRMLKNADHLDKNDRHGKKGNNWENTHQFYIGEWDLRYERFQAAQDAAPMSMNIPMSPAYMAWYNKITVTYLTQSGARSTAGMNESASSMRLFVEGFQQVFHLTTED